MIDYKKYIHALRFAVEKHKGQFRKGGLPYITHPVAVAEKLRSLDIEDDDYLITALFHDLLEDTDATEEQIEFYGGKRVLQSVKLLTKTKGLSMEDYVSALKSDPIAKKVKEMDRLHNLECAVLCDEKFKRRYILETIEYYCDFSEQIVQAVTMLANTLKEPFENDKLQLYQSKFSKKEHNNSFILHGDICYSQTKTQLKCVKNAYLVCIDGKSKGVFEDIPTEYTYLPVHEYENKLIIPGLVDLHIHAPQYSFRGMCMDLELMDWLKEKTFPEENKYENIEYAKKAYDIFASMMKKSATTHAVIFATKHRKATELLMDLMEDTGIVSYVGKVNMDSENEDFMDTDSADMSAYETFGWINSVSGKYKRTHAILTPRFIPCCSPYFLEQLSEIQATYDLPVQSHLSENKSEIELVHKLYPSAEFYGDAYDSFGLFGKDRNSKEPIKTVMAHCVHSTEKEIQRIKENGVFVAHCPTSNINLSSGIAPIRKYLDLSLRIGLGSDVAGGHTESILHAVTDAVQASKMYWQIIDNTSKPLTFNEAFYLATKGGGEFFGKVGSFEEGYDFSAVILDDSVLTYPNELSIEQRLESSAYSMIDSYAILAKYVDGEMVFNSSNKQ